MLESSSQFHYCQFATHWIWDAGTRNCSVISTSTLQKKKKNTLLSVRTTWATPEFIDVIHSVSSSAVYRVFARLSQDCLSYSFFALSLYSLCNVSLILLQGMLKIASLLCRGGNQGQETLFDRLVASKLLLFFCSNYRPGLHSTRMIVVQTGLVWK